MIAKTHAEIPERYGCKMCGQDKPIDEMMMVHRKRTKDFLIRTRCKACNNTREKGNRRDYKRRYLQRWRRNHPELSRSYWRKKRIVDPGYATAMQQRRNRKDKDAIAIQRKLRTRAGVRVSIQEARDLLRKYGVCYPSIHGLTPEGRDECQRIRSRLRRAGAPLRDVEIRVMVYEDGYFIDPRRQRTPQHWTKCAERLRNMQARKREAKKAAA